MLYQGPAGIGESSQAERQSEYNVPLDQLHISEDVNIDMDELIETILNDSVYVTSILIYGKRKSIGDVSKMFYISKNTEQSRLKRMNNSIANLD